MKKQFKKVLSFLLALLLVFELGCTLSKTAFAVTPGSVSNPTTVSGQWKQGSGSNSGRWWYKHDDGTYTKNDWEYINSYWYHFDSSGWMDTGWYQENSSTPRYYLGGNGKMRTGFQTIGNYDYYFYVSSSVLGQMKVGWKTSTDDWYYFDSNGHMLKNQWFTFQNNKYYFGSDGIMATGFRDIGNYTYYFYVVDDYKGQMKTGWKRSTDDWCYFDSEGHMLKSQWLTVQNDKYYFGSDGIMLTGFQDIGNYTYYFIATGDNKGKMKRGWRVLSNGDQYYFDTDDGHMLKNQWLTYNNEKYFLGPDGKMITDHITFGNVTYRFYSDGRWHSKELNITHQTQHMSKWCWAACLSMVASYRNNSYLSQEDIVEVIFGSPTTNEGMVIQDVADYLSLASNNHKIGTKVNALNFSDIQNEIYYKNPIIVQIVYPTIPITSHCEVLSGYDIKSETIYLNNPASSGVSDYYDYSYFLLDGLYKVNYNSNYIGAVYYMIKSEVV